VISLILRTATRFLMVLMLLFSLFLLLRGHNAPGGGFIGGLVSAAAFVLYAIAHDVAAARRLLRLEPRNFIGAGLFIAAVSGIPALFAGQPFLTGLWGALRPAGAAPVQVGTPLFFDLGVYLTVLGVTLTIVYALLEE
jgi:multicomponent Na+:H+ antiporter subunit B